VDNIFAYLPIKSLKNVVKPVFIKSRVRIRVLVPGKKEVKISASLENQIGSIAFV
jgi:hypothetical protein